MLAIDTVQRAHRMPVDFATYLLSSSPPATNLELFNYAFSPEAQLQWQSTINNEQINNEEEIQNEQNINNLHDNVVNILKHPNRGNEILINGKRIKPIIIRKEENTNFYNSTECSSTSNSGSVTPISPCSPGRTKRVSFADNKGLSLVTVKIMTEPSDQPPCLDPEILRSITNGVEVEATGLPPYKLNFTQPASDYMAFHDKIEKNCVSLENVIIRDHHVIGTVKVKNICFNKRVFIRCTFDCWKSSQDIECKYVKPYGSNLVHNFDTFSFEFVIDSQSDRYQSIQFAVAYETVSSQFWDNNSDCNYHIIPTDFNTKHTQQPPDSLPTSMQPSLKKVGSWSEYGGWHQVNATAPYY